MSLSTVRRWLAVAVSLVLLMTISLFLAMPSQTVRAQSSTVSINPTQGPAGSLVTAYLNNWRAGETMYVIWEGNSTPITSAPTRNGPFSISFHIPSNAPLGRHNIQFFARESRYFLVAVFTVTSTRPGKPGNVDLAVLGIQRIAGLLCVGSFPTFRAFIRNSGSRASPPFNIRWIADGKIFDGSNRSGPVGVTVTHDHIWAQPARGTGNLAPGQHTLTFIANFDHRIPESNYNNNQRTIAFVARACAS